jgi:general secretion pathway protein M
MSKPQHQHQRAMGLLALALLTMALLLGVAAFVVKGIQQRAEQRLADIEPRHARLLGLQASQATLHGAIEKVQSLRAQWAYPSTQDAAQAGNTAQQRVREIFMGAGLQVLSSQVLPPKEDKDFDRIWLTLRTEGDAMALQSALALLSAQQPVLMVSELEVQAQSNQPNMAPRLAVQWTLSVMRARS